MTRFECPACGAKIRANQDITGRTIECPGCHEKTLIAGKPKPVATEARLAESPPLPSPLPTPFDPEFEPGRPGSRSFDITGRESEHQHTAFVPAMRRINRRLVIAAGASCFAVTLTALAGQFYVSRQNTDVAAKRAKRTEIVIRESSESLGARFKSIESVTSFDISGAEAHPVSDERKRRGVWEFTAIMTVYYADKDLPKVTFVFASESILNTNDRVTECWRELRDTIIGQKNRVHSDETEWNDEFRAKVRVEWLKAFRGDSGLGSPPSTDFQSKITKTQGLKESLAKSLEITPVELQEIIDAGK